MPEPRRDAEVLAAAVLETDRGGVLARRPDPLPESAARRLDELVRRRAGREPLQYVLGREEFHGLEFRVDRRALIPRPETEGVVDAVLGLQLPVGARVADLGTGSGCIAVSLAVARPDLRVVALDRSREALALARENAARHEVAHRIRFLAGEFDSPPAEWRGVMDVVVSNPPYVAEDELRELASEIRDHEPRGALAAGPDGLAAYGSVIRGAGELLAPDGFLVLELGFRRERGVRDLTARAGFETVRVQPDLQGIPRVLVARRSVGSAPKGGR